MSSTTTLVLCLGTLLALLPSVGQGQGPDESTPFRIAFTSDMFTDVNENDAKASVKAWATTIARERGIEVEPEPEILQDIEALTLAVRNQEVDAVGITSSQYLALESEVTWGIVFAAIIGETYTSTYYLLVHTDSGIDRLDGLHGRHMMIHSSLRTSLVEPWLGTLLNEAGLPPASEFLGEQSRTTKLSQVILPIFFGQADACIASRRGFETLAELNPQVGKSLRVLASSTELIPGVFCFRADYETPAFDDLVVGVRELHQSAAGRQVLTIFQSDQLVEIPPDALDSARELLGIGHSSQPPSDGAGSITDTPPTHSGEGGVQ